MNPQPSTPEQMLLSASAVGFLPLVLLMIPLAIGNFFLARRIDGASPVLWAILSPIPMVNGLFLYYVGYKVVFTVLDRLRALRA